MSDGELGEAPMWYRLLKVARWLGVAPWDLARQPVGWFRMAEAAVIAEAARKTGEG